MRYDLNPLEVEKEACRFETVYRMSGGFNLDDDKLVSGSYLSSLAPLAIDFATRKAKAVKNVKVVEATLASVTEVKGKYTLTIGTIPANGDKISVGGVEYEFVTEAASGKATIGATTTTAAAALKGLIDTDATLSAVFDIATVGTTVTFTQKVGGTGSIPAIVVTQAASGTLAATIATTTSGVAARSAATVIKIAKKSLAYVGMFLSNGTNTAAVTAINASSALYDVITITLGALVADGDVLFEAAESGTTPLNVANFLNYARVKVEAGATITAIGQVFEIKESKLTVPVSAKDKVSLGARFMFV